MDNKRETTIKEINQELYRNNGIFHVTNKQIKREYDMWFVNKSKGGKQKNLKEDEFENLTKEELIQIIKKIKFEKELWEDIEKARKEIEKENKFMIIINWNISTQLKFL